MCVYYMHMILFYFRLQQYLENLKNNVVGQGRVTKVMIYLYNISYCIVCTSFSFFLTKISNYINFDLYSCIKVLNYKVQKRNALPGWFVFQEMTYINRNEGVSTVDSFLTKYLTVVKMLLVIRGAIGKFPD
jgi:hypothetical protein